MKMADVTQFRIPEGLVQKISVNGTVLWQAVSDGLPSNYVPLSYIEFDGNQYVDTGIICTQDSKIEMKYTRQDASARYLFCASSSDNAASVTAYQSGTASGNWRFGATYARPSISTDVEYTFVMDKTGILWNGSKINYYGTVGTFGCPVTLALGTSHGVDGSFGTVRFVGQIFTFKIWDGDNLVLEYLPCRNPEGKYGFWDNVAKVFRPSEGPGEFWGG